MKMEVEFRELVALTLMVSIFVRTIRIMDFLEKLKT